LRHILSSAFLITSLASWLPCAARDVRFEKPGLFLDAQPGASYLKFRLPAAPKQVYDRITIRYRMHIAKFQQVFNSFIGLTRPDAKGYFAMQIRADKSKTLIDRKDHTQYGEVVPWKENTEYAINIVYDAAGGTMVFEARLPDGSLFQRLQTQITNRVIEDAGGGLELEFGLDRVYDHAYFPPLGWKFSDLTVILAERPARAQLPAGIKKETHTFKTAGGCGIQLDVYRPEDNTVRPAIFWLHGGALIFGHRGNIMMSQLKRYLDAGLAVISVDYRLAPETKLPEIMSDIDDAWRWVQANGRDVAKIDPARVGVVGHSAGGYLTLSAGHRFLPRPKALVAFYGYGDIVADWLARTDGFYASRTVVTPEDAYQSVGTKVISGTDFPHQRYRYYLYVRQRGLWPQEVSGRDPSKDAKWFRAFCPVRNVGRQYPPTLLLHGDKDTDVPFSQSEQMAAELKDRHIEHQLIRVSGGPHVFDGKMDDPAIAKIFDEAVDFLKKRL
jgi:acetyl esterase/lipase